MKKSTLFPILLMGVSLSFFSCSDDDPDNNAQGWTFDLLPNDTGTKPTEAQMSATVTQYVDHVVLPTYKDLLDKMTAYTAAVDKFVASNSQNDLSDACTAWRAARVPWEQSEAFLFGVADKGLYDPSLDSWPLDKNGIDKIIESGDFSNVDGDVDDDEDVPADAPQNLRGFHTAERMLFDNGDPRQISKSPFSDNEKKYLQIVSKHMLKDVTALYNGWDKGLGDINVPTSYGEAMKKHDGTSAYTGLSSIYQAIETILNGNNGMAGISNEVGTAKIQDPVDKWNESNKDASDPNNPGVLAVESWYSWNSIDDYANNIVSIKNSYFGGRDLDKENASTNSLHALVKVINPTLDSLMVVQIDKTIEAIEDMPRPFRNNLGAETEIKAATDACKELTNGLGKIRAKLSAE